MATFISGIRAIAISSFPQAARSHIFPLTCISKRAVADEKNVDLGDPRVAARQCHDQASGDLGGSSGVIVRRLQY
jgi:hypothetical protein